MLTRKVVSIALFLGVLTACFGKVSRIVIEERVLLDEWPFWK